MRSITAYKKSSARLACAIGLCLYLVQAAATTVVSYPLASASVDSRYEYDWILLRAALDKTRPRFGPFEMRQSGELMSAERVRQELLAPQGRINLFTRTTSREMEKQFLPIRIPIDRGLIGYRIFLVREHDLPRFAAVRTLDDLRAFQAGLGKGWTDVPILAAAGFRVQEGTAYDGMFTMLTAGRFDFFSRSVDEALREYRERHAQHPGMAVEPTLLLHYPMARYFFVRRDAEGAQLARRITAGLEAMLADGSLHALFFSHKGPMIDQAGLRQRRLLRLPNPDLPPETPLARKELWYDPFSGK